MAKKASKKERKAKLGRKLAGYSVAAGAALALGATGAQASVIYTPVNQSIGLGQPNYWLPISLDGHGIDMAFAEMHFIVTSGNTNNPGRTIGYGNLAVVYGLITNTISLPNISQVFFVADHLFNSYVGSAKRFVASNSIKGSLFGSQNQNRVIYAGLGECSSTLSGSPIRSDGNFLGQRGFLGLETIGADGTHYGWVDLGLSANADTLTIYGYAWETEADTPIHAAPVPEPGTLALLAVGAAGLAVLRRKKITDEASA